MCRADERSRISNSWLPIVLGIIFGLISTIYPNVLSAQQSESAADLSAAIKQLGSGGAAQRRSAFKLLVAQGVPALELLEKSAREGDTDLATKCVEAIILIGRVDHASKSANEVLGRIANDPNSPVRMVAQKHMGKKALTKTDRLIQTLQESGAVLNIGRDGSPVGATVVSDDQIRLLKGFPELEFVSMKGRAVTDNGMRELIQCNNVARISINEVSFSEAGFSLLHHLPRLSTISFLRCDLSPDAIRSLARVETLTDVRWYSGATPEQILATTELKQIRSLHVGATNLAPEFVATFSRLPNLAVLRISIRQFEDQHVAALTPLNAAIELTVFEDQLTEEGWTNLANLKLQILSLYRSSLTDAQLPNLGRLTELTRLTISDCEITDQGIAALNRLEKLTSLRLRRTAVTQEAAEKLQAELPKLSTLNVETGKPNQLGPRLTGPFRVTRNSSGATVFVSGRLDDKSLKQLKELEKIRSLYLSNPTADDKQLAMIASLPVERLNLRSQSITDSGLRSLVDHTRVQSLSLQLPKITDNGIRMLGEIDSLTSLTIDDSMVTDVGMHELIRQLAKKNQLKSLGLNQCPNVTNDSLSGINQIATLNYLSLGNNERIDGSVLAAIGAMPQLRSVHLTQTPISAFDLVQVAGLNPKRLQIRKTQLQDGLVERIVTQFPKLEQLSLTETNVRNQDMALIAELEHLQLMDLYRTQVDIEGLKHLMKIDSLIYVTVNKDQVSESDIEELGKTRPKLRFRRI